MENAEVFPLHTKHSEASVSDAGLWFPDTTELKHILGEFSEMLAHPPTPVD